MLDTLALAWTSCRKKINFFQFQNIRRYVVSWIVVVVMIVVIQLMVLFDVIHVVNNKSSEASDKSFLYTALEVFCLCECSCMSMIDRMTQSEVALRCRKFKLEIRSLHFAFEYLMTESN